MDTHYNSTKAREGDSAECSMLMLTQLLPSAASFAHKQIALVTGSATGVGANIARDLASTGRYFVIVTGRDWPKMIQVVRDCNQLGLVRDEMTAREAKRSTSDNSDAISAVAFKADLLQLEQIDLLIEFIESTFGRCELLVNNACWRGDANNTLLSGNQSSYDDFKKVMHVNLSAPMYLIRKCLISLRIRTLNLTTSTNLGDCVVVNISSIASQMVVPLHSYSISKACLSEMSHKLASDAFLTKHLGISFVTISPGPVFTDERPYHEKMSNLTLLGRVGTTQEISNLVLFVLSNPRLFNGKEMNVDGGYTAKQRLASNPTLKT